MLRVAGSGRHGVVDGGAINSVAQLAAGSQVEVGITCNRTAAAWPGAGKIALRTLATVDGAHFTETGWDFARPDEALYVNHTHCCHNVSTIVQRALTQPLGDQLRYLRLGNPLSFILTRPLSRFLSCPDT